MLAQVRSLESFVGRPAPDLASHLDWLDVPGRPLTLILNREGVVGECLIGGAGTRSSKRGSGSTSGLPEVFPVGKAGPRPRRILGEGPYLRALDPDAGGALPPSLVR